MIKHHGAMPSPAFRYSTNISPTLTRIIALATLTFLLTVALRAEHDGKVQIALLGDSTTEELVPRIMMKAPGPYLADTIRLLLAGEKDLPPCNVINCGIDGEFIQRLLEPDGKYDRVIAKQPGLDYIFIRFGLNDIYFRKDFDGGFPEDYHALLARLRQDHPSAMLIPMTVIPIFEAAKVTRINALIRQIATGEKLQLLDIYTRYAAELERGPNMLNYRRFKLAKIPEKYHELVKPFVHGDTVIVLDNRLDAHFFDLPGWFGDRHPNQAGYHVIADETVKFLAPLMRQQVKKAGP